MKTTLQIVKENGINPLSVRYLVQCDDKFVIDNKSNKMLGVINLKSMVFTRFKKY